MDFLLMGESDSSANGIQAVRSMSKLFPESPVLFYPSLARRFGAEQAILLAIYYQYAAHHGADNVQGNAQFVLRRREWLALTPFFDEERLAQLTSSLVDQAVLDAQFQANGSIRVIVLEPDVEAEVATMGQASVQRPSQQAAEAVEPRIEPDPEACAPPSIPARNSQPAPVSTHPSPFQGGRSESAVPEASSNLMGRGPAPSFGGSTGWAKPKDDLELLFERQELHHQQLKEITPNWQPQQDTLQLLAKKSITQEFSLACADQFVAYYMGQGQRKKSWEQPFMKWVMREWVDAQKKQYREQATKGQQGFSGERDQTGTRQDKRERITSSVMDINNIDWI
ncbi:MAG: hypothetical protein ACJAWL_003037 [Motiliproteus sp.]